MIERIALKNFKACKDISISIAELTVLSGFNSSGKSTIFQALGALRQSYNASGEIKGLVLGGDLVHLGQGRDVLSNSSDNDYITISIKDNGNDYSWKFFSLTEKNQLEIDGKPIEPPLFITNANFQFLQADRIVPSVMYPQAPQQVRDNCFLGVRGEYTFDYLSRNTDYIVPDQLMIKKEDINIDTSVLEKISPTNRLLDQIAGWMQHISPGVRFSLKIIDGTDAVQLQYNYVGLSSKFDGHSYRPNNVGFGLTYSLPIITACLSAKNGSLLLLENPEAHLHPQGQVKLGELLALCANMGIQIIVETHSDHILNGIRLAVKNKIVRPQNVALHFFIREVENGESYVQSPIVKDNGKLSDWPKGFFDQWDNSIDSLVV